MLMGSARGTHACWNACSVTRLPPSKGQGRTKHCTERPAVSTTPPPEAASLGDQLHALSPGRSSAGPESTGELANSELLSTGPRPAPGVASAPRVCIM